MIRFTLPVSEYVTLKVYDLQGREVVSLLEDWKDAGVHSIEFDARRLPSGVYFYKLQTEHITDMKKLLLMK